AVAGAKRGVRCDWRNNQRGNTMLRLITLLAVIIGGFSSQGVGGTTFLRGLFPRFFGPWGGGLVGQEARYFSSEGLDVEVNRVGGSTRMVAAMLGGSAPIIQAGASAAIAATGAGSDVVIIAATGSVSPFRLMARPEINQPLDLKGKRAGITTFGSTSD